MYPAFKYIFPLAVFLLLTGCAAKRPISSHPDTKPATKGHPPAYEASRPLPHPDKATGTKTRPALKKETGPAKPTQGQNPRALAAVALSDQGRELIERNRPDEAIRVLERAVNLHPQNGENYYYLAEAWLLKGNAAQATEFHQLAAIYLKDATRWQHRLKTQAARIAALR